MIFCTEWGMNNSMKRACVIGCGAIGPVHCEGIRLADEAVLAGVCDVDPVSRGKLSEQFGARGFASFDEVLASNEIDAVHLCVPHYLHTSMAKTALQAGKIVVLEKPPAMTEEQLSDLLSFVEQGGFSDRITVVLQNRRNACVEKMKEFVQGGALGALRGIVAQVNWCRDEAYYNSAAWRGTWKYEGGGLLMNQAIHTIDLMLWLGGKASDVRGHACRRILKNIEVEDTADILILFENGVRGVFSGTNGYSVTTPASVELEFEGGRLRYADQLLYQIVDDHCTVICRDYPPAQGKACWGASHAKVIDDFYRFLAGKGGNHISLTEAVPSMELIFQVYHQSRQAGLL